MNNKPHRNHARRKNPETEPWKDAVATTHRLAHAIALERAQQSIRLLNALFDMKRRITFRTDAKDQKNPT